MKVLVLGSERGDFFAHNVAYTLREMGHEVISDSHLGSASAKGRVVRGVDSLLSQVNSWWMMRDDRRAIELVKKCTPDLVVVCTKTYAPETVALLRKAGAIVICWYGDSPANIQRGHITSGEYDAVFVKDARFAKDLKNVLGINAFHLHEACNPDWHKPTKVKAGEHVAVAGTMYGYRNRVVSRLLESDWEVRSYGPSPSSWVSGGVKATHTGIFLDHTNKAETFGTAMACLNTFAPAERDSLNCRIFETCGSGGLLISEHKTAMDECFDSDVEYLPFSTFDELLEQLERIKSDHALAVQIRKAASRRAHAEHTYKHRITSIFKIMNL